jgi:hypothetical protein
MTQCSRQLTEPVEGFLLGKRYLLHDRDEKFVHGFELMLHASGVEPVVFLERFPVEFTTVL